MLGRRELLKLAGAGAAAAITGAPAVLRAQAKGKVRLAYLQLGWAATEIIHKEDLLGRHGWSAEYSVVPGAPGPLLSQLAAKNVDAIDMSFALAAKAFEEGVPLKVTGVATAVLGAIVARKDAGLSKVEDLKGRRSPRWSAPPPSSTSGRSPSRATAWIYKRTPSSSPPPPRRTW